MVEAILKRELDEDDVDERVSEYREDEALVVIVKSYRTWLEKMNILLEEQRRMSSSLRLITQNTK